MAAPSDRVQDSTVAVAAATGRISFDRLRERTDELELLVSGLFTFSLFAMPGWIVERYADLHALLSPTLAKGAEIVVLMGCGLCLVLAGSFLLHLLIRAYWIGLIGLKSAYPEGIRWDRVPGTGPISLRLMQQRLPDLSTAIDRVDTLASNVFAATGLATMLMLYAALLQLGLVLIGWLVSLGPATAEQAIEWVLLAFLAVLLGSVLLLWLLDARLAAHRPGLAQRPGYVRVVSWVRAVATNLFPERLIGPVQLTLSTNTRPVGFIVALSIGAMLVPALGATYLLGYRDIGMFGDRRHLSADALEQGFSSAHYESMRVPGDRLRTVPMIPTDIVERGHVRLFIPHVPRRDAEPLAALCAVEESGSAGCLQRLWQVTLDGEAVPIEHFMASHRSDLGLRGLLGYIDVTGLAPGQHRLELLRNQPPKPGDKPRRYVIPFVYAPEPATR